MPKKTILIVDDDAPTRTLLKEFLEPEGYQTYEAADGADALKVIASRKIDLLITDRAMPGMSGLELLKTLKDKRRSVPALMISAYGEEKMWGDAIAYGAQDYLLKPFKPEEILKIVKRMFSGGKK